MFRRISEGDVSQEEEDSAIVPELNDNVAVSVGDKILEDPVFGDWV